MNWARNLLALFAAILCLGAAPAQQSTLIRGARIFDGTGAPAKVGDVLVRGDRIVAVGPKLRAPRGGRVVDARGLTLLPGLHDLHTHLRAPAFSGPEDLPKAYASYLLYGVTTVNDFSVSGEMLAPIREMTSAGGIAAPNLQLAIRLAPPAGHGTEYGWGRFFTMQAATPRAGQLAMAKALPYKPDVIKVFADGWRYGRMPDLNSMNEPTLSAIVKDAHGSAIPVITHTVTLEGAKVAAAAGVDALGHGIGDALVDAEVITLMKTRGTAYVPTLVVYEPQEDRAFTPAEWQRLRPPERSREQARIAAPLELTPPLEVDRWKVMQENVRRLRAGGVRIGIGTDAGIGGVFHGSSTIREIRWLTKLGLTPAEALAAATSVSAEILRQGRDHGRITPGQRADIILTGGRPDERIDDLYDIRRVFVAGAEMPLAKLRRHVDSAAHSPLPLHRMSGPIDTGARADGRTDLDTLPVESNEPGIDNSHLEYVQVGEPPNRRRLLIGYMGAAAEPFAQLMIPLTRGAIQLADARKFTGVAFNARGGGGYSLLLETYGMPTREWFRSPFSAGNASREVRIPFSAFRSPNAAARLDLAGMRSIVIRLEGQPGGTSSLEIGNVRFYR